MRGSEELPTAGSGNWDPLLFGQIELVCFLVLFCSPFLPEAFVQGAWYALALWRVTNLASLLYFLDFRATGFVSSAKMKAKKIGESLLYSLPFWGSSFCFPLRSGQAEAIGHSALLFLALTLLVYILSFLRTHWFPAFLGCVSFAVLQGGQSAPELCLQILPLSLFFVPRSSLSGSGLHPSQVQSSGTHFVLATLVMGSGWALCLILDFAGGPVSLTALSRVLLCWLLLTAAGSYVLGKAQDDTRQRRFAREVELALPGLEPALHWLYGKCLLRHWAPWLLLLPQCLGSAVLWPLGLVVLIALPGLLAMARRGGGQEGNLAWWCCAQFVILWGVAEFAGQVAIISLCLGMLLSLLLSRAKSDLLEEQSLSFCVAQAQMENRLTVDLRSTVGPGFAKEVLAQSEPSVDIDESLASAAPSGFRERLLERLRQTESETD